LLTPIQVAGQNVQLVIHPLINSLKSYWTFPDDPRQVTVDLGLITKDPCLWKHLPETLPAYSRAVSYMDAGDDANIRIKIVDLKDYKLIPLCTPWSPLLSRSASLLTNGCQLLYAQVCPESPKFSMATMCLFRSRTRTVLVYLTLSRRILERKHSISDLYHPSLHLRPAASLPMESAEFLCHSGASFATVSFDATLVETAH
jgi:hypothetical protein